MYSLCKKFLSVVLLFSITGTVSYTYAFCGDWIIDLWVEQCDGPVAITCADFWFDSGAIVCNSCIIDSSWCFNGPIIVPPVCGDGIVDLWEECDSTTTSTCADFWFDSGIVSCTSCSVDSSWCFNAPIVPVCGDGIVESWEECDSTTTSTCADFWFDSGTVSCTSCSVDSSWCFNAPILPVCGDWIIEGVELCDDWTANGSVCTPLYWDACNYCSSDCEVITIEWWVCGDWLVQETQEMCDHWEQNWALCSWSECTYCSNTCERIQIPFKSWSSSSITSWVTATTNQKEKWKARNKKKLLKQIE